MAELFEDKGFPAYLEPIEKKIRKRYSFIKELTPGKNGMTFVLQSKLDTNWYCLKTISPAVTSAEERERVRNTLIKEVEISIMQGKVGVLSQILDGPVDCDKIDYLKRDSWHCGMP